MLQVLSNKSISAQTYQEILQYFIKISSMMPQGGAEFKNTLSNGLFLREMKIGKGSLVISAEHANSTILILSQGSMKILSDKGLKTVKGHSVIITPPGVQRIGYALETSIATCIYRTDAKTVEEAISECIIGGPEILVDGKKNIQIENNRRSINEANNFIDWNND